MFENNSVNHLEVLHKENFKLKLEKITQDGLEKLIVITDFDGILIKKNPNFPALISVLRHPQYSPLESKYQDLWQ